MALAETDQNLSGGLLQNREASPQEAPQQQTMERRRVEPTSGPRASYEKQVQFMEMLAKMTREQRQTFFSNFRKKHGCYKTCSLQCFAGTATCAGPCCSCTNKICPRGSCCGETCWCIPMICCKEYCGPNGKTLVDALSRMYSPSHGARVKTCTDFYCCCLKGPMASCCGPEGFCPMEEYPLCCCLFRCCVRHVLHEELGDAVDHMADHAQDVATHAVCEVGAHVAAAGHEALAQTGDHAAQGFFQEAHRALDEGVKEGIAMFDEAYPMDKWEKVLQQIIDGKLQNVSPDVILEAGAFVFGKKAMDKVAPGVEMALKLIANAKELEDGLQSIETLMDKGVIPDGTHLRKLGMSETANALDRMNELQQVVTDAEQGTISDKLPEVLKQLKMEKVAKLADNLNKAQKVELELEKGDVNFNDMSSLLHGVGLEKAAKVTSLLDKAEKIGQELEQGNIPDDAGDFLRSCGLEETAKIAESLYTVQQIQQKLAKGEVPDEASKLLHSFGIERLAKITESVQKAQVVVSKLQQVKVELEEKDVAAAEEFLSDAGFKQTAKVLGNAKKAEQIAQAVEQLLKDGAEVDQQTMRSKKEAQDLDKLVKSIKEVCN